MPSTRLSLHPYKLSNLDLVTESLTLSAGNNNLPSFVIEIEERHKKRNIKKISSSFLRKIILVFLF